MKKIVCIALIALSCCATAFAQHNFRTGYFLDGYIYKHKLNPALASDRGYFAIGGYISAGVETDLALSTFLYPDGPGNLTTFLDPNIKAEDFLSAIKENNPLNANVDVSLLSMGFHLGKCFNTLDLSLKADVRTNIPGSLFSWAKQYDNAIDMSNLGLNGDARLELAYGVSRKYGEKFRFGVKFKAIAGLAKANYTMDNLSLTMDEYAWSVKTKGSGYFYAPTVGFKTNEAGAINGFTAAPLNDYMQYVDAAVKAQNFGAAIDLGFSWDMFSFLTVSASVTDLGYILWNDLSTLGSFESTVAYTGFDNIGGSEVNIGEQFEMLGNELLEAIYPKVTGTNQIFKEELSATAHAGVELRVPFYKRLSVGVLATHRFDGAYSWKELRGSVNWAFTRWLSFSASHAESTFGQSFGGAVNFHPAGLNIFIGVDSFKPAMNVTPQYIPIDSFNTNIAAGVSLAIGKYRGRFLRKSEIQASRAK
jgi:hypothetical protein